MSIAFFDMQTLNKTSRFLEQEVMSPLQASKRPCFMTNGT